MANERIKEDMSPVFPDDDIICKDCAFRKFGSVGYKNAYCKVFTPEISNGKPNDILFENGNCDYYTKDDS